MIPKVIHYCWFGGNELPKLVRKCMKSWKKYCPDYEIIEWNENNFDIDKAPLFVRQAYDAKKWAFVSDYVRLYAIYNYGGVYLDTDAEVVKSIDSYLTHEAFTGFEAPDGMLTCIMGSQQGNEIIKQAMSHYETEPFINENGEMNMITNVILFTELLTSLGFKKDGQYQQIDGFAIYPREYFCPLDDATGKMYKSDKTAVIHWFNKSWVSQGARLRSKITKVFHRVFGVDCFKFLKRK